MECVRRLMCVVGSDGSPSENDTVDCGLDAQAEGPRAGDPLFEGLSLLPAFAVRDELRDPRLYLLERALSVDRFLGLARECGLDVAVSLLEWYEDEDLFRPSLLVEGKRHYSRWQLLHLAYLEEIRALALRVVPGIAIEKQGLRPWRDIVELNRSGLVSWAARFYRWLELVVSAQNACVEVARGHLNYAQVRRTLSGRVDAEDAYVDGEYRNRIRGGPVNLGLSIEEAKDLRLAFGLAVRSGDPLDEWYRVMRFVPMRRRDELRGTARLKQELYVADRILQMWFRDLTGEDQPDTDELGGDPSYDWARQLFGRVKDYRDPLLREAVLTQFGLHPAPRAVLFLDGATEEDLVAGIVQLLGFSLPRLGVEVESLRGGQNTRAMLELIDRLARPTPAGDQVGEHYILRRPVTHVWVVIDLETGGLAHGERLKLVRLLQDKQLRHTLVLSDPDLERENFEADLAACVAEVSGKPVDDEAVQRWVQRRGRSLELLLEELGVRIGKRDLVPAYLKRIEADIEANGPERSRYKIVREVFRMVRTIVGAAPSDDPRLKSFGYYG